MPHDQGPDGVEAGGAGVGVVPPGLLVGAVLVGQRRLQGAERRRCPPASFALGPAAGAGDGGVGRAVLPEPGRGVEVTGALHATAAQRGLRKVDGLGERAGGVGLSVVAVPQACQQGLLQPVLRRFPVEKGEGGGDQLRHDEDEDPSTLLCRLSRRSFTVMPVFWKCAWPGSPAFLGDPAGWGEAVGMGRMGLGSGSAPGRASSKPTVDSGLPDLCRPLLARREAAVLGGSSPGCCAGARSKGLTWLNCTGTRPMGPTLPAAPRAEPSTATGTACTAAGLAAGRAMAEVGAPEGSGDVDTGTVGLDAGDLVGVAVE